VAKRRKSPGSADRDAYRAGLALLAATELSEVQLRRRLARTGCDPVAIDEAVARLKAEGSLDDDRAALAIARREAGLRRRGPHRVRHAIAEAGISAAAAERALEVVFGEIDAEALLERALARRLRPGERIRDDRHFARLYRYLTAQGFDADAVMAVLRRRRETSTSIE
jgi:SOS response regulatory protein OraA/RecX